MPVEPSNQSHNRRLRLGMVGGGPGAFIGAVHRIAARLDDRYELVAAALSSNAERSLSAAEQLHIPRAYRNFEEMASAESKRPDGIEVVSIVTPNHLHHAPAKVFLEAGINVICDKPLTTTLDDALDLAETVKRTGLVFGLTHNYTGHPMVRQAREMVMSGELGPIRLVQVEYAQDWLATPLEKMGQKQAEWRTDPTRSGPGGSLGDIGTHAFNLACFVTGLSCKQVAADVTTFVPGRRLDDNVQVMLRFSKEAKGGLWASQVAPGNENNLRLRVYGEKAGLEWCQEDPNELRFAPLGQPHVQFDAAILAWGGLQRMRLAYPVGIRKDIWRRSLNFTATSLNKSQRDGKTVRRIQIRCSCPVFRTASKESSLLVQCWNLPAAARHGLHFLVHSEI